MSERCAGRSPRPQIHPRHGRVVLRSHLPEQRNGIGEFVRVSERGASAVGAKRTFRSSRTSQKGAK
ncbi:protein of unknown function [Bradyrhizobium vignae]|uniref:Uncharacterized protein n=1 Tax=Bradyrhizobium vignae TaxID=1549949 RepID=A0A2U3QCF2_9BRAD|nr:protein of unknown function [Bradyrhizobium vignae]